MKKSFLILFILFRFTSYSQTEENSQPPYRNNYSFGLSKGVLGPGLSAVSASLNLFVLKNLHFELGIGIGLFGLTHVGNIYYTSFTHYHSFSKNRPRWNYFYGIVYANYESIILFTEGGRTEDVNAFYFASGIQYLSKTGFSLKFDIGPGYQISEETWHYNNSTTNTDRFTGYIGFKVGKYFKK